MMEAGEVFEAENWRDVVFGDRPGVWKQCDLAPVYVAAEVQRWHCNPALAREGQTNGDHQGRCVQLLLLLCPDASPALIRAVAFHDVGERFAGDLSRDFKNAAPDVARAHAVAETAARSRLVGPDQWLTEGEQSWLKLVDQLEATAFCLLRARGEYFRTGSGWLDAEAGLFARAEALGVGGQVRGFIQDLKGGRW